MGPQQWGKGDGRDGTLSAGASARGKGCCGGKRKTRQKKRGYSKEKKQTQFKQKRKKKRKRRLAKERLTMKVGWGQDGNG